MVRGRERDKRERRAAEILHDRPTAPHLAKGILRRLRRLQTMEWHHPLHTVLPNPTRFMYTGTWYVMNVCGRMQVSSSALNISFGV